MKFKQRAATERSEPREMLRTLATFFALLAVSGCGAAGAAAGSAAATAVPSAAPSPSIAIRGTGSNIGVCTATPTPGCQMVADPFAVPSTCHFTMGVLLSASSNEDKLPSYGYGAGPVYLSGQNSWYLGGQGAVFLINPSYTGAVHITGQLIGNAETMPVFIGPHSNSSTIDIPSGSAQPYWRFWDGQMSFTEPGCYTLTLQSAAAKDVVTIYVHVGDAPPG